LGEAWQSYGTASPPTVFGRHVYVTGLDEATGQGAIIARDVATGDPVWSTVRDFPGWRTMIDGDELLVVGDSGPSDGGLWIDRYDRATGALLSEGDPYVDTIRGSWTAATSSVTRGDPVWRTSVRVEDTSVPGSEWSTPVIVGSATTATSTLASERALVSGVGLGSTDPSSLETGLGLRAYALDAPPAPCATDSSGAYPVTYGCPVWAVPLEGTTATAPVLADDLSTVVVGTDAGLVYAIDEATGAVEWSADVGSAVTADPGIANGMVLVPTASNGLVALPLDECSASSCPTAWSSESTARVVQQPVSAGGVVFVAYAGGELAAHPVIGNGQAVVPRSWRASLGAEITIPMAIGSDHLFVSAGRVLHAFAMTPVS
jgi:outer membrane protein assembly factor BamB